jgi:hypothetical protein
MTPILPEEVLCSIVEYIPDADWSKLCSDRNNLPFLHKYSNNIDYYGWYSLCSRRWALPFLRKNIDKIYGYAWEQLCRQQWAIPLLMDNVDLIGWFGWKVLYSNKELALPVIMMDPNPIPDYRITKLCRCKWALPWLMKHVDKITPYDAYLLRNKQWAKPLIQLRDSRINA